MLNRNKLREILLKYQMGVPKSDVGQAVKKLNDNSDRHTSNILKDPNEKLVVENIEENNEMNAVELTGRRTPIEYFTYKEKDFQHIKPKEPTDYSKLDIFHRAISPRLLLDYNFKDITCMYWKDNKKKFVFILIIAQCFSLLPVSGVGHSNPRHLRFSYKSIQVIITLILLIASSTLNLAMMKNVAKMGVNAKNIVGVVFYASVQSSIILFFALAPRWPRLIRYWTRTEMIFVRKPYEMPKRHLASRIRCAAYAIIILSAVEHMFSLMGAVISHYRKATLCAAANNQTVDFTFNYFTYVNYEYAYMVYPNTRFVGGLVLVINFICTFVWNFMDIFIMMVAKGIAYRFEQIKMRINKLLDKEVPEAVFMDIRVHYVKLIELLEYVDENLSGIMLLTCANNLYFVCYQLLNIFNKLRWPINYVYFWYSLLFLIGRTAFVLITAASINDEAKDALNVLRRVPSKTWCIEVERLIFQMTTTTVALSGRKFFYVTRRLLLGMAGTIVTYELVLLQFDEPNRSEGLPDLCS